MFASIVSPTDDRTQHRDDALFDAVVGIYREHGTVTENCLLCNPHGTSAMKPWVLSERDRYGMPARTLVCTRCGFSWTADQLDEAGTMEFYSDFYRDMYHPVGFTAEDLFNEQTERAKPLLQAVRRHLKSVVHEPVVLDVGCGSGGVAAYVAQSLGGRAMGLDFDERFLARARHAGVDAILGDLSCVTSQSVDVVIASHVLEHVADVGAFVRDLKRVLRPGGIAVIEVPSLKRVGRVYGRPIEYLQSAHLWNFSKRSLSHVFMIEGLEPLEVTEVCIGVFAPAEVPRTPETWFRKGDGYRTIAYLKACDRFFAVRGARKLFLRAVNLRQVLVRSLKS
jgi:SAM-dependent methyltransferase